MSQTDHQGALHESAMRFVLGDLDPDESRALERRLGDDPELAEAVRRLRATLDLLPHAASTPPPAALRARVLRAGERARVVGMVRPRRPWAVLAAVAAALVALVLGLDGVRLRRELAVQQEVAAMLQEPNVVRSFRLAGTGDAGDAYGTVALDLDERKGAVALRSLPALPAGRVYRLWAQVGSDDVACGDFRSDADGRVVTQFPIPVDSYRAPIAKLFVTVEPADGVGGPTGPTVMESA